MKYFLSIVSIISGDDAAAKNLIPGTVFRLNTHQKLIVQYIRYLAIDYTDSFDPGDKAITRLFYDRQSYEC